MRERRRRDQVRELLRETRRCSAFAELKVVQELEDEEHDRRRRHDVVSASEDSPSFLRLPDHVLEMIASYLVHPKSCRDIAAFAHVSRRTKSVASYVMDRNVPPIAKIEFESSNVLTESFLDVIDDYKAYHVLRITVDKEYRQFLQLDDFKRLTNAKWKVDNKANTRRLSFLFREDRVCDTVCTLVRNLVGDSLRELSAEVHRENSPRELALLDRVIGPANLDVFYVTTTVLLEITITSLIQFFATRKCRRVVITAQRFETKGPLFGIFLEVLLEHVDIELVAPNGGISYFIDEMYTVFQSVHNRGGTVFIDGTARNPPLPSLTENLSLIQRLGFSRKRC